MKRERPKLRDIVKKFDLRVVCGKDNLDREVGGGYTGDLLSDVMARAQKGDIWITRQAHPNIVAVAAVRMLAGIVIINDRQPDEHTVQKAKVENLPLMTSPLPAFELSGQLHAFGVSGLHDQ